MQGYATEAAATVAKRAAEKRRTDALLKQVQTLQTGMIHVLDENQDPGQRATTIREVMRQNSSLYWKGVFDVKQRTLAELALKRLREEKGGARRVPRVLDRAEGRKEYAALDPQATAEDCDFASFLAVTRGEICFAYLAELDEAEQRRAVSFLAREFAGYVAWAARLDQLMEEVDALRFLTGMDIAKAHVHERAAGLLGCRRVIIWMVDAQEVWSVQSDPTTGLLNEVRLPFEGDYSPVLEALRARKPLRFERTGTAESMLFCPIFHGQQTVAILEAKGKQDDASFTSEDEFCMRVYGPAAAHLIRTQKEQESRKRDERRTQVFLETLKEMLRGLNREEDVMRLITQLLHDAYGAVRVAITVENAGNGLLRLEWDEDARRVHHAEVRKLGLGFGGLVAQAITDAASSFVPAGTNAPLHSRLADLDAESTQDLHTFPVLDRGIAFCVLQWTCPGSSRVHAAGKNFMHQNLQEAQRLQWMLQLFLPALKRLFPSEGMMKRVVLAARDAMARKQKALPPSHSPSQASPAPEASPARRP
jgi:GAF domain-containing protein